MNATNYEKKTLAYVGSGVGGGPGVGVRNPDVVLPLPSLGFSFHWPTLTRQVVSSTVQAEHCGTAAHA